MLGTGEYKGILISVSDITFMPRLDNIQLPSDCTLIFDATQILGLIAGNALDNPLDWFNEDQRFILMGATHKTLPGPTCGLILTKNRSLVREYDTSINPDYLRNSQLDHVLGLILTLMEMEAFGNEYARNTVQNAQELASDLYDSGFEVLSRNGVYTETQQVFIHMDEPDANVFLKGCDALNITLNKRARGLYKGCGIRLGLQEVTRYGWSEPEMRAIASILANVRDFKNSKLIKRDIEQLTANKQVHYTFDKDAQLKVFTALHNS